MTELQIVDERLNKVSINFVNDVLHKRFPAEIVISKVLDYFESHPGRNNEVLPLVKAISSCLIYRQTPMSFYNMLLIAFYLGSAYKQLGWPKELQEKINKQYPSLSIETIIQQPLDEEDKIRFIELIRRYSQNANHQDSVLNTLS